MTKSSQDWRPSYQRSTQSQSTPPPTRTYSTDRLLTDTLVPLWLGAGKASGNAVLGGAGAALQGIGQLFDPTKEQLAQQRDIYRTSGEFVGLPEEWQMLGYVPPPENAITKAGRYLLNANAKVQDNIRQAREDLLGVEQGTYTRAVEGIGAMLIPFMLSWASGGGAAGKAVKALTEAGAETGDFATNNRGERDAAKMYLKNFLANIGLNTALELTPDSSELIHGEHTPTREALAKIAKELFEESMIQEPIQRIIRDANGEHEYTMELMRGLREYPRHIYDITTGREQN